MKKGKEEGKEEGESLLESDGNNRIFIPGLGVGLGQMGASGPEAAKPKGAAHKVLTVHNHTNLMNG